MRASLLLAVLVGIGLISGASRAEAAPPPHWLCPATWYGTLDGCDVGCGNYDIDCDTQTNLYNGCPSAYPGSTYDARTATSDPKGDYTCGRKGVGVPNGWTCNGYWYDRDDGCDCGCGEIDPDCADNGDSFYCWSGSGTSCSATATCQTAASSSPAATYTMLHFGGMGSNHFEETSSSKLNNTSYKVRLANSNLSWTKVDAWVDLKTATSIPATYNTVVWYLDTYCSAGKTCGIYTYSAGANAFGYAYAATTNRATRWPGIVWHVTTGAADGGSDLANWGRLAEMVTSPVASTLTKTTQRGLWDHNIAGNGGITTYRNGGKGHSAWAPWGWSSTILWAATAFIGGEDDGAVGVESAAGCTSSASRSDMNCTRFAGHVCNGSCTPLKLDHYEMKVQGLIQNGW